MDRRIEDKLERYLGQSLEPRERAEFEAALQADTEARTMVDMFEQHAKMLRTLRAPSESELSPGFYARVMDRIEAQRAQSSIWAQFLEPLFFRRIALASAALLVLLGVMLVSPAQDAVMASAEHFLAVDSQPAPMTAENQGENRDALLVTLTTYGE